MTLDVAIVDHSLGNLFSVKQACVHVGLSAEITADSSEIDDARAVILPGVGAFEDAMATLKRRDLIKPVLEAAASGRPLLGICLGFQLLMSSSEEFGVHEGLDLMPGRVIRFDERDLDARLKVPQIGWNRIFAEKAWSGSLLDGIKDGESMYFLHSYYVVPDDSDLSFSSTQYGAHRYCSVAAKANVFGCQFHPEKSGREGLKIYANLARHLLCGEEEGSDVYPGNIFRTAGGG